MSATRSLLGSLTTTNLRAARLALRGENDGVEPVPATEPALASVVADPFDSVQDAEDRLSTLERLLRERADRRAVFLSIYVRMTGQVRDGLEAGRFDDGEWMRRYLITFADYYRRAFLAYERGEFGRVPDPWRVAFGRALRGDGLVVQDAFLGVNAHINYDLALAIRDIGIDPNRAQKHADHERINTILADLVDVQQEMLADRYAPGVDDVDAILGRLDETFTLISMRKGREQAWRLAVVMTDAAWWPVRHAAQWVLEVTATGAARFITSPSLDPTVLATLRQVERERIDLDDLLGEFHRRVDEVS